MDGEWGRGEWGRGELGRGECGRGEIKFGCEQREFLRSLRSHGTAAETAAHSRCILSAARLQLAFGNLFQIANSLTCRGEHNQCDHAIVMRAMRDAQCDCVRCMGLNAVTLACALVAVLRQMKADVSSR